MNNHHIISALRDLAEQIKVDITNKKSKTGVLNPDIFRLKQTMFLIKTIENIENPIKKGSDLSGIKGIGPGSIKRIDEIIENGHLKEVTLDLDNKKYLSQMNELEQVYGIGSKTAYSLIKDHNIKDVKTLEKKYKEGSIELPYHIQLGLKYHNKYKITIPREEIDTINIFIKDIGKEIDPDMILTICGSYRRGKPFSNDIDILVVNKNIKTKNKLDKIVNDPNNCFKKLVNKLHKVGFLLDDIDKNFEVKYMGFGRYKKKPIRRIDMMFMPYECYGSSLLHFTGPGDFNKRIREVAIQLGYSLSQYGLLDKTKDKIIKTSSEKDIFDKLFMEYIPPEDRDSFN